MQVWTGVLSTTNIIKFTGHVWSSETIQDQNFEAFATQILYKNNTIYNF